MNQDARSSIIVDPVLNVFHVGGRGPGMGPVERLLPLGENLSFYIFEANIEETSRANQETGISSQENYDRLAADYTKRYGAKVSIIQQCLSNLVGKKAFHINVIPDCSSLLNISPDARNYARMAGEGFSTNVMPSLSSLLKRDARQKIYTRMPGNEYKLIWEQACQPTRTIEINVTTLDELYNKQDIPLPHFLSLDVQGVEFEVLQGAAKALQGDLLGVIAETEFSELYEEQKLFIDQSNLLKNYQFRLFELYNTEYWYSGPIVGKGALTVAEALFLRDFRYFVTKYQEPAPLLSTLSKLAIVAYAFERISYAFEIIDYMVNNWPDEWAVFVKQDGNGYVPCLSDFYQQVIAQKPRLDRLPTYLEFMAKRASSPPRSKTERRLKQTLNIAYNVNLRAIVEKLRGQR